MLKYLVIIIFLQSVYSTVRWSSNKNCYEWSTINENNNRIMYCVNVPSESYWSSKRQWKKLGSDLFKKFLADYNGTSTTEIITAIDSSTEPNHNENLIKSSVERDLQTNIILHTNLRINLTTLFEYHNDTVKHFIP